MKITFGNRYIASALSAHLSPARVGESHGHFGQIYSNTGAEGFGKSFLFCPSSALSLAMPVA